MVSFDTGRLFNWYALPFCKAQDRVELEVRSLFPIGLGTPWSRLGTINTPFKFRMNVRLPLSLSWDHVQRLRWTSMCSCA
jgi:hypothetical protein